MTSEQADGSLAMSLPEKYDCLFMFLGYIDGLRLAERTVKFDPGRKEKILSNNQNLAMALPESIRSISFPNGESIKVADKSNGRTVDWDIYDVLRFTNNLGRMLGKWPLQFTYS